MGRNTINETVVEINAQSAQSASSSSRNDLSVALPIREVRGMSSDVAVDTFSSEQASIIVQGARSELPIVLSDTESIGSD